MNPRGARVLVTGASSGIGAAAAAAFAGEQCSLYLVARREAQLEQVAADCRQRGAARVVTGIHDLSRAGQGERVVQECRAALGGLDILICNAGYGLYGPVASIDPADMARQWQVNFQSGFESIRTALPQLLEQSQGHIILVSSIIGRKALPFAAAYCATKFAQAALGESLWGELRGSGVGVSLICPGFTATEFSESTQLAGDYRPFRRPFRGQEPSAVAAGMVQAVRKNRREVHFTWGGKLLLLLNRLSPSFANWAVAVTVGARRP